MRPVSSTTSSKVAVCGLAPVFDHVTVPPGATSVDARSKAKSIAATAADDGGGSASGGARSSARTRSSVTVSVPRIAAGWMTQKKP